MDYQDRYRITAFQQLLSGLHGSFTAAQRHGQHHYSLKYYN